MVGQGVWWWWLMSSIETGGGATVDGDAHTQDFVGRDRINIDFSEHHRKQSTLEERVMDLERMVYGEKRWAEPGLIRRMKRTQITMTVNVGVSVSILLLLLLYLWR